MVFRGVISHEEVAPLTRHMTTQKWMQLDTELVRIGDLWATQPGILLEPLIRPVIGSHSGDEYPHVVIWNGISALEDGHHRAIRAALRGEFLIECRVLVA